MNYYIISRYKDGTPQKIITITGSKGGTATWEGPPSLIKTLQTVMMDAQLNPEDYDSLEPALEIFNGSYLYLAKDA